MMTKLKINLKSYKGIPAQHQDIDVDYYIADPDWIKNFVQLCQTITQEQIDRHIGAESTYHFKNILLHSLKFHYAALSGVLKDIDPVFNLTVDQKTAIISKIEEEIEACTPGFHARIESLLASCYFVPKTIADLLTLIRYNIVESAATKQTTEVHTNNRFFIVAKEMGFGVEPKLANDPYTGNIPEDEIKEYLQTAFDEKFQPFSILLQLKTQIISTFGQYIGRKETGYKINVYGPGLEYLKNLFQETEVNYDYLITDKETNAVYDINWNLILKKLWDILLQDKYFDYSSRSKTLNNWGLLYFSKLTKSDIDLAISAIKQIFLDPGNACLGDLKKLHHLFKNPAECVAYLCCNPDLTENSKMVVLFSTLDSVLHNNTDINIYWEVVNNFWQLVLDNTTLADAFGKRLVEHYPKFIEQFKRDLLEDPLYFKQQVYKKNIGAIKLFSLKLGCLPEDSIGPIIQNQPFNLYWAIAGCQSQPEVLLSFIHFIPHIEESALRRILAYQYLDGSTILSIVLSRMSKGHANAACQLLNVISSLPTTAQFSILQLDRPTNHNNPVLKAINHCPSAVPSLLNLIFTQDYKSQIKITSAYLSHPALENKNRLTFRRLLELNQGVNSLAHQPDKVSAYKTAQHLQTVLINSLNEYFENSEHPNAFSTLKNKWDEAILQASATLSKLPDWNTLLKNLSLVVVSIPLLGIPLAVNYYISGYKRVFFQSQQAQNLEHLREVVAQETTFINMTIR
ncbi:MAG: hypothetical protein QM652_13010 [Legionella sp.]|uniref:hypothetical protein n=1 Tax=Legionella sp. TaxID=459 RepID=UPI0039E6B6E7